MALETVRITSIHKLCTKNVMEIDVLTHYMRPLPEGYSILYIGKYVEIAPRKDMDYPPSNGERWSPHDWLVEFNTDGTVKRRTEVQPDTWMTAQSGERFIMINMKGEGGDQSIAS